MLRLVKYIELVRRNPSAGLLFVQILGVLLYPLMETSPRGRALFGVFGLLVLAIALWVVRRGPWLTWLGVTLALPVVVLSVLSVTGLAPEFPWRWPHWNQCSISTPPEV